jgi:hypothetical protein
MTQLKLLAVGKGGLPPLFLPGLTPLFKAGGSINLIGGNAGGGFEAADFVNPDAVVVDAG